MFATKQVCCQNHSIIICALIPRMTQNWSCNSLALNSPVYESSSFAPDNNIEDVSWWWVSYHLELKYQDVTPLYYWKSWLLHRGWFAGLPYYWSRKILVLFYSSFRVKIALSRLGVSWICLQLCWLLRNSSAILPVRSSVLNSSSFQNARQSLYRHLKESTYLAQGLQ